MSAQNLLPPTPLSLPLLPLRDVVVFPHMVIPLFVGRPKSIKALESAMAAERRIMLVAQKAAAKDEPTVGDMFDVGSVATILQMLKLPDGTVKVLVEGVARARVRDYTRADDYYEAEAETLGDEVSSPVEVVRDSLSGVGALTAIRSMRRPRRSPPSG